MAREDSEFAVLGRQVAVGGQLLELQGLGGVYSEIFLPLHGEHQAHNAVVALAAVEAFFGAGADRQLDIDTVRAGFAAASSPGRLERMRTAPTVFVDAAHNPAGAAALAQALQEEFDFRFLVGVVSVMADKDVDGILAALEPVFDQIVVTNNGSPRAMDVEALALRAEERFGPSGWSPRPHSPTRSKPPRRSSRSPATRAKGSRRGHGDHRFGRHRRGRAHAVRKGPRMTRACAWGYSLASGGPTRPQGTGRSDDDDRAAGARERPDPWKSFRGVMAGTLILEAIVVLLALPVVAAAHHGLTPLTAGYLIGFAIVLVLLGGVQGRPWAIWVNLGIQVVLIAGWVVHGAVGFIGLIFTAVWLLIAYLRAEVLRRQKHGLLPGQQSPPDVGETRSHG